MSFREPLPPNRLRPLTDPVAFESDEYRVRRQAIEDEFKGR